MLLSFPHVNLQDLFLMKTTYWRVENLQSYKFHFYEWFVCLHKPTFFKTHYIFYLSWIYAFKIAPAFQLPSNIPHIVNKTYLSQFLSLSLSFCNTFSSFFLLFQCILCLCSKLIIFNNLSDFLPAFSRRFWIIILFLVGVALLEFKRIDC